MKNDYLSQLIQGSLNKPGNAGLMRMDPFFRYIGGKKDIAKVLVPYMPEHTIYVEPFMGSAAMFYSKPRSKSDILNDMNEDITNLFKVLRDKRKEFIELCWLTPFTMSMHQRIYHSFHSDKWKKIDEIHRAFGYYYLLANAFNESVGNMVSPSIKFDQGKIKWTQMLCQDLFVCSKKLDGVIIMTGPYMDLINNERINKVNSFWYFDPPYTMADGKNYYKHNFLPQSHHEFCLAMPLIKGKFMISYDPDPLVIELFKNYYQYGLDGYPNEILITNYEIKDLKPYEKTG